MTDNSKYFMPVGYKERLCPAYFDDSDDPADVWQPDVYLVAGTLADRLGATAIVDVGCGRAAKLLPLADTAPIIGIDYGANVRDCMLEHPEHRWIECDLEHSIDWTAAVPDGSIVVCSDVIEHLVDPNNLLTGLCSVLERVQAVVISTPDRDATHGPNHMGPPPHEAHVREWSHPEFTELLLSRGVEIWASGLTRSCSTRPEIATSMFVLRQRSDQQQPVEPPASAGEEWNNWSGPSDLRLLSPTSVTVEEHLNEALRQRVTQIQVTDLRLLDSINGMAPAQEMAHFQLPPLQRRPPNSAGSSEVVTSAFNLVAVPAEIDDEEALRRCFGNIAVALTGADASALWWPLKTAIGLRRRLIESQQELLSALQAMAELKQWIDQQERSKLLLMADLAELTRTTIDKIDAIQRSADWHSRQADYWRKAILEGDSSSS
ncbi:MAG: class I SAM-dependent methyltransferase [Acidimicrobiales bacterium]